MKKNNLIIGVVVLIIIIGLISFVVSSRKSVKPATNSGSTLNNNETVIPTVDSSVLVNLVGKNNNKAITLTLSNLPPSTTSAEYSLSYQTKAQGLQGIIGTLDTSTGEKDFSVSRDLGTCSSGTCVYHEVVGAIKVEVKFTGSYGEKLFDKDFEL